jgi:hypothetical protein
MSHASYGLVLIFLTAGCVLGWHANKSYASHGDVKSTKAKIPGYRRSRHRNGVRTLILAFVIAIVMVDLLKAHP